MAQIYCGNSMNYSGLLAGTHVIGTNYECLRKGIGIGSHLPYDPQYALPYAPIDPRQFYCGNAALPAGYFAVGSPSKCLQTGIGIGKAQKAALGPPAFLYFIRYILPYVLIFFIMGIIFISLYYTKPSFLTLKDDNNNIVIDWTKFIPYYITFSLLVIISIYGFWIKYVRRWI